MTLTERLETLPVSRFHYLLLISAGLGWMFDSMDTGIISFVLPVLMKAWNLSPEQVGTIGSIGLVGMAIGAILSGTIADLIGRKKVFASTLIIYSIATGLCGLSWNYESLLFFRFLVGFGLGGQLPVAVTLVSEFSPAKHRGKFLVLLESFWAIGWLLAALVSYVIIPWLGWQSAFYIGALPALYVFYLWKSIPESPRYLASKGKLDQAESIVKNIEIQSGIQRPATKQVPQQTSKTAPKMAVKELFSRRFIKRTVFLWLLWFGIVFAYYGIFTWLPSLLALKGFTLTKSFQYVMTMTLAQIPGYFSAAYLVDKIGRKPTLTIYLIGTAISAYFFGLSTDVQTILLMGSLMSFFNLGAWGIVYTYTPELYPTHARATGSGWAAGFGRIGGILAPIVVGLMIGSYRLSSQSVFLMFSTVLILTTLNVIILGEETKGRPMDEDS
ncbi:MFS transporter [Desulfosporosinus lacus]|uniref:MFS transporter, putative metabolite:H+ symporter n=1 Tax=Desulfosporosinus lacus DSM 15449 TaxID=1121420 RepID=A0A1M5Z5T0_9FIRM|nr:MFS transporter [Desulfosporosinus lacus]SHI19635.1 MFS transporter, putative metabolite:H+ symporter [Desulfosporosinus lacus DSM 15449]